MKKTNTILALLIAFWGVFPVYGKVYTVLLDPGHGGEDKGGRVLVRRGNKKVLIMEKDIALALGWRIYRKLKRKKYRVFLSRKRDYTVKLQHRADLVDTVQPDLYISIHINSSPNPAAHGFETYYLDNHKNAAVKKLEQAENKELQGDEQVIKHILNDLAIQQTVKTSRPLAHSIHRKLVKVLVPEFSMIDRGVRPGLFYVLALARRPAVLLEAGFISNRSERRKLLSKKFQDRYAAAVAAGVDAWFSSR